MAIAHAVASALIKEKAQPLDLASAAMQHLDHRELVARFERACSWLADAPERLREPREVRRELGNGMTALTSCATATYIACAHLTRSFEELLLYARACGGDTDTISAMAGAIWGASRGADDLPQGWFEELEDASHLRNVARALGEASGAVE